jgi:hypothetical protein
MNPGLMQSHEGASYNASDSLASITQMGIDGVHGTKSGEGLVQGINKYANIYEAARYYDSGAVNSEDLNDGVKATGSYVNDVANRMTGWVSGEAGKC